MELELERFFSYVIMRGCTRFYRWVRENVIVLSFHAERGNEIVGGYGKIMNSKFEHRRNESGTAVPSWALILFVVVGLIVFAGVSIWLFNSTRTLASVWEVTDPQFEAGEEPLADAIVTTDGGNGQPSVSIAPLLSTDGLKAWNGQERVNILLLGIDLRCGEEGPTHTDSMMVFTIDPVGKTAAMLSLPRDLWVEIPGFGLDRINQAHYMGAAYEYPGGGPALAMETVEATLGIELDYYAAVNFKAFTDVVDLIDGIEIEVTELIDDPDYPDNCYGYDPLYLEPGTYQMGGEEALKYARTRATFGGDVDRAGRQQEVIMAVRDKVLGLNMLPQLMLQSPQLWQSFQENVRTNMSLDEMLQLALLMQDIDGDDIETAVIDYQYVYNETTPDGRQVLVPNREEIRVLREQLFMPPAIPTATIDNLEALAAAEGAGLMLVNGTAEFGLAGETQTYLEEHGLSVVEIGNADASTYRTTQLTVYGNFPYTTQYIIELMGVPPLNVIDGTLALKDEELPAYGISILIGDDWRVPTE